MNRRNSIAGLAALTGPLALSLTHPLASAQSAYPNKPIRLVIPFPAGGATDILGRAISVKLAERLGQAVVIDNRPGAGGTIGSDVVAKAAPDGYTLLLCTTSTHSIGPALNPKMPYDAVADFTPIAHVANSPNIVLVPNSSPAKTLAEFIALAKSKPGQMNYGSSGNGTIVHLSTEVFKAASGTFIVHIPYRGTALAMPDLISGKLDVMFDSLVSGLPHVKDGKLRALAITSAQPSALASGFSTVASVVPGYESNTWFGVYGPKGLSADVVSKVNAALNAALADPDLRDRFARLGAEPVTGTPAQFASMVQRDAAQWKTIIQQRKISVE